MLREALKDEIEKERSAVARLKEKLSRMEDDGNSSEESVSCCQLSTNQTVLWVMKMVLSFVW